MIIGDVPPKLWTPPRPAIIRAASLKEIEAGSFLPGFRGSARIAASVTCVDHYGSGNISGNTSMTLTNRGLGSAPAAGLNRIMLLGLCSHSSLGNSDSATGFSSVSVDGQACTSITTALKTGADPAFLAFYYCLLNNAHTTGTVQYSFSGGNGRSSQSGYGLWAIYTRATAPFSSATTGTTGASNMSGASSGLSNTIPWGGVAVGLYYNEAGSAGSGGWNNLTSNFDESAAFGPDGASLASAGRTATVSTQNDGGLLLATFASY